MLVAFYHLFESFIVLESALVDILVEDQCL